MATHEDSQSLLEHAGWVKALARRLAGGEDRGADASQETWLAALERPPRRAGAIRAWLRTVVANAVRKSARGGDRRERRERSAARPEAVPSAAEVVERAQLHRLLVDEVLALDEPYRSTILFHFFEGLSAEEIGLRAGVPAGTVRVRLHRALEKLRERLDARSGGDRTSWCWALAELGGEVAIMTVKTKAAIGVVIVGALLAVGLWFSSPWSAGGTTSRPELPAAGRRSASSGETRSGAASMAEAEASRLDGAIASGSISGLVVDSTGRPVAGAKVTALRDDEEETVSFDGPDARFRATADETGRFTIAGFDTRRRYDVVATADGVSSGVFVSARPGSEIVLSLAAASTLSGRVRDLSGMPVAGARVAWSAVIRGARIEIVTVSGSDGAFRVDGIPATRDLEWASANLLVEADGFAPAFLPQATPETVGADFTRDVVLTTGATIRGRVVDAESGEALGGARVALASSEGATSYRASNGVWRSSPFGPRLLEESTADGEGRFEFRFVPAWGPNVPGSSTLTSLRRGLGSVMAAAPGFVTAGKDVDVPDPGDVVEVEVACWPSALVTGRVLDERGDPVADARVHAKNADCPMETGLVRAWAPAVKWATTDAAGRYALEHVAARSGRTSTAVVTAVVRESAGRTVDVVVTAGAESIAADIVCESGAMALVLVTDSAGEPISGAIIATGALGEREGSTDVEGRATIAFAPEAIQRGVPMPFFAWAAGYAIGVSEPVMPEKRDDPPVARIALEPEHRIRGRVRHENGLPATPAFITVARATVPASVAFSADGGVGGGLPPLTICGTAESLGADGSFEVAGLPPGPYHVSARRHGGPEGWIVGVVSDVPTGATDVEMVLANPAEGPRHFDLSGTIRDAATGEPVYRVEILLWGEGAVLGGAMHVDLAGRFVLRDVTPGEWLLTVASPGYLTHREEAVVVGPDAPLDRSLDIRLERGATLRGTIRASTGERFAAATAQFTSVRRGATSDVAVDADGSFEATGFRPGTAYGVFLRDKGPEGVTRTWTTRLRDRVEIARSSDGGAVVRDFEVVPACGFVLRFRREPTHEERILARLDIDGTRSPSRGLHIEVRAADGFLVFEHEKLPGDNWGTFVPEGEYVARLFEPGRDPVEKRFPVVVGESTTVDFFGGD